MFSEKQHCRFRGIPAPFPFRFPIGKIVSAGFHFVSIAVSTGKASFPKFIHSVRGWKRMAFWQGFRIDHASVYLRSLMIIRPATCSFFAHLLTHPAVTPISSASSLALSKPSRIKANIASGPECFSHV